MHVIQGFSRALTFATVTYRLKQARYSSNLKPIKGYVAARIVAKGLLVMHKRRRPISIGVFGCHKVSVAGRGPFS